MNWKPTHLLSSRKFWLEMNGRSLSRVWVIIQVNPSLYLSNLVSFEAMSWKNRQSQLYLVAMFQSPMAFLISSKGFQRTSVKLSFLARRGTCLVTSLLCRNVTTISLSMGRKVFAHSPVHICHLYPHGWIFEVYLSEKSVAINGSPHTQRQPLYCIQEQIFSFNSRILRNL